MGAAEDQLFQRFGREFPAGTQLFAEGEPGHEMYVVQTGVVQVHKTMRDVAKVIGRIGPGEFFGEMALLNNKPRNATAVVLEDARLLVVDGKTFEAMIRGNTEIAVRLIRKLAARLDESNEQIETLLLRDPASRLVHLLWKESEKRSPGTDGQLTVPLAVRDLPSRLGLRPDLVDDVLTRLGRLQLAYAQPEAVVIPDIPRFQQYLEYLEMKERFGDV